MKRSAPTADCNSLVKLFLQHKLTLALAESCTCGLVAAQLAPAEGISDVLLASPFSSTRYSWAWPSSRMATKTVPTGLSGVTESPGPH
ncbi:MAG: hypothetical protein EOO62_32925, partial [Hymenobacter sp.]